MKEFIANRKLIPLISFMEKVLGISQLKHFSHRSQGSVREIYLSLGDAVKQTLLKKVRKAKSFGLLMDEVTDITVSSQLISFIQFWDQENSSVTTMFLSSQNALEDFASCNSEAITELVKKNLVACNLDINKRMGLSTDGASVMVGKNNGVAAKLRQRNSKLLNMHCVCHRLALACTDTCQELKYIREVEDVLRQLWYYFHNSPKRMACFLKCQIERRKVRLNHTERGGSVINITKTKFRNRLNNEMLNSLMQVSINGSESNQCSDVVKSAVDNWLKQKPRKKLKKPTVRP